MTLLKKKWAGLLFLWLFILAAWQGGAWLYGPEVVPGPADTAAGALELLRDGSLPKYIGISFYRVFSGWMLGSLISIPLGILIGKVDFIRRFAEPLLNFIRFIPPIAFITLFLVWFGIGEQSKIALILYATLFIVIMNTLTGVLAVEEDKIRAARSMGASEWQIVRHVIVPATAPYIFTGVRLAMGTSYMAIVGAEMIAANEGVGYLIWNSRLFFRTDWIFVGLLSLGLMGFATDRLFGWFGRRVLWRYGVIGTAPAGRR
ncbi:MAG: ABC transporter permease [Paenibacillus macerans]|uniref:Binding--dependent transport system inner membrane component family protein n=1 Tax=Paenibacillus macerans TaxID=44252 RepID=A0A090ZC70_PAEMA|nr:ABC transporter permease [Paenibacillus macerans]KFN07993.1 binding--dependent transport system inner membrane component family protein [Paenibacillus macerans]MBS5909772.1 ABC transporter permease [Paenibacillus macerans]MCY7556769.1 ABC transporter permease [Paenibacillus macerans]MDU7474693.1 ABC transporter permease [Paenibacillus macerans]MEC0136539.1 ABC transporter permease [Paenibacillus macerans]